MVFIMMHQAIDKTHPIFQGLQRMWACHNASVAPASMHYSGMLKGCHNVCVELGVD